MWPMEPGRDLSKSQSNYFFNVYLFLKEREIGCEWGRSRERRWHRIRNRFQALSCQHRAWRGARTHEPGDQDLTRRWLLNRATQVPQVLKVIILFNVYLLLRDRVQVREGQRKRETQNPKRASGSELSAQSLMPSSNSRTGRSWPEPKSDA